MAKLRAAIKSRHIKQIDFKFTDLFGRWHHITVPPSRVNEKLFTNGVGFDGSNFAGMSAVESGDLALVPELDTGYFDPFRTEPAISFICRIVEADSKKPFSRDPRSIALTAESYLRKTGIADRSMWGPEFEYYVFDEVRVKNSNKTCSVEIVPGEGLRKDTFGLWTFSGYHGIPPEDTTVDIRDETVTLLEEAGIKTLYHHHEVGGHGQVEIEVDFGPLARMGDISMMVKHFARMTAHKHGKTATFMPKPLYNEPGTGMHFHQFLLKKGTNVFYRKGGYADLSPLAHHYIAGLLRHAPSLLAFTNPSTNSYKRLVPGFEAPVNCFFSLANRSAAIRIPKYATDPGLKRMEFRPPDATCNTYIAMAAQLMAGIDGIRKKLDPAKEGFGPFDVNVFEMSLKERAKIKPLPGSFAEALRELDKDHAYLLEGGVFTESMIRDWIRLKREKEIMPVRNRPHPLEIQMYLDC
ncbi:MAG: type I glutamate--ammonia ligase [Candidatus Krumholzibacteria bacterium]|nr:type I glutamate--ammonia ligase [Candidatus Krumholzibacteria bacterium]